MGKNATFTSQNWEDLKNWVKTNFWVSVSWARAPFPVLPEDDQIWQDYAQLQVFFRFKRLIWRLRYQYLKNYQTDQFFFPQPWTTRNLSRPAWGNHRWKRSLVAHQHLWVVVLALEKRGIPRAVRYHFAVQGEQMTQDTTNHSPLLPSTIAIVSQTPSTLVPNLNQDIHHLLQMCYEHHPCFTTKSSNNDSHKNLDQQATVMLEEPGPSDEATLRKKIRNLEARVDALLAELTEFEDA